VDDQELEQRLSRITTYWTVVFQAHRGGPATLALAQEQLLNRYSRAIFRYLLGAVRDPHAADELAQEFALHFLQGNFKGADPGRGRFRDYVKTSLFHLIARYHNKKNRQPLQMGSGAVEPAAPLDDEADRQFLDSWREELLARTWEALKQAEQSTGKLLHTVLHFRARHPDATSAQMAEQLGTRLGKALTAANVRQLVHRAREKFADLLLDEVARSLGTTEPDALAQELVDLDLLPYCQEALKRRGGGG
jgi:RNA polymerase sigma factor (sigma-70 family)